MAFKLKPLDFVLTPGHNMAVVTCVDPVSGDALIAFLDELHIVRTKNNIGVETDKDWWEQNDLKVVGSLPSLLSKNMSDCVGKQPYTKKNWRLA